MTELTDGDLVQRVREGDRESYSTLVSRYQGHVYGLAYSLVNSWADAQDIAQETFIRAYVNLDHLRDPQRFATWLRRVAFSVAMKWLRTFRPKLFAQLDGRVDLETLEIPDFAPGPQEVLERKELAEAVQQAIRSLPPKYRVPLTMFHLDGLSFQKVADFLDIPLGTAKSLIHRARGKLRAALGDYCSEDVVPMVQEVFNEHKLPAEFRQEVLKRIGHWERFDGSDEEKIQMVAADPEWRRLVEFELTLEPMSDECRRIRRRIAWLEGCHEHYTDNVRAILTMIAAMVPQPILDCRSACEPRQAEARAYAQALRTWLETENAPTEANGISREVLILLGPRTKRKAKLVQHLVSKLEDNEYRIDPSYDEDYEVQHIDNKLEGGEYRIHADDEKDFIATTESRIQHLEICNYNWAQNLRIVLQEIAAGKRLFPWHTPEGYNAHGDYPDRIPELQGMMADVAAWAEGNLEKAGEGRENLGKVTKEKRWLVASLCKTVAAYHQKYGGERLLARPSL